MRRTIRDLGYRPGFLPAGERNSITDVGGTRVGSWTLHNEQHHTGVTVVIPRENIYDHPCTAAGWVLNGYGKSAGLVQIKELGLLESPVALTNTLNVGLVSDALVQFTADEQAAKGKRLRSFNPVVGECNDGSLNRIEERVVGYPQVMAAMEAAGKDAPDGCIGAGAGMTCHGLKGGLGSASRLIETAEGTFTVGVLGLCNHGELQELTIAGNRIGPALQKKTESRGRYEDQGSCILLMACDLPLSARQLERVIKRCAVGMARCGSYWGHGSGDIIIGWTTAHTWDRNEEQLIVRQSVWNEDKLDLVFAAAAEAAEEAVLNALAAAQTTVGFDGTVRYALADLL